MPTLTVTDRDGVRHTIHAEPGARLRDVLLAAGLSPYVTLTERANCGGRGLCATCGVWIAPAPAPTHWHDRAAAARGYPRLSCQIQIEGDATVEIPPKRVWGRRRPGPAR